jgi:hypothetical protein
MKKYLLVGLLVLIAAAAIYFYYSSEQPVSLSEFKSQLNSSNKISIVEDTRSAPSMASVINCGTALVLSLETNGRNTNYFTYGDDQCFYGSLTLNRTMNASIKECESMLTNSLVFYIRYNAAKNSTSLYKSKAVIEGDENFLLDCAISRLI